MEYSKRKNNIELCRICIMFFIVVHHCIVSGLGLNETLNCANPEFSIYNVFLMLVNSVVVISVNVFWLISGYFGVKFKTKKIESLLCEIAVCSVLVYAGLIIAGQAEFTIKKLIRYSLLSINLYWFAIVYIAIVITSPALNCIWKYVIEPNENNILCGLFLGSCILCFAFPDSFGTYLGINNGYSYLFSVFLYFTGKTIRKYEDVIKEKINLVKSLCGYVITCLLTWGDSTAIVSQRKSCVENVFI